MSERVTKADRDWALEALRTRAKDFRKAEEILTEYLAQVWTDSFLDAIEVPLEGDALKRAEENGEAS